MLYSVAATFAPGLFTGAGLPADVYYEAVSSIVALILLGRLMEARAKGRTSEAMRRLLGLAPKTARVFQDGVEVVVPATEVAVGDLFLEALSIAHNVSCSATPARRWKKAPPNVVHTAENPNIPHTYCPSALRQAASYCQ